MNTKIIEWSARRIHAAARGGPGPAVVQGADAEEAADPGRVDRDRGGSRRPRGRAARGRRPSATATKNAYWCRTPRRRGLTSSGTGMRSIGDTVPGWPHRIPRPGRTTRPVPVRPPAARRHDPALRPAPGGRRGPALLGRPEGSVAGPRRQAPGHGRRRPRPRGGRLRGPPRRRDPRQRRGHRLGPRHVRRRGRRRRGRGARRGPPGRRAARGEAARRLGADARGRRRGRPRGRASGGCSSRSATSTPTASATWSPTSRRPS